MLEIATREIMFSIKRLFTTDSKQTLRAAVEASKEIMQKYRDENVFKSNTMKELLTDRFDYTGYRPNTILLKNMSTGEPIKAQVKFTTKVEDRCKKKLKEVFTITDEYQRELGTKDYSIQRLENGKCVMYAGDMESHTREIAGVGVRLDQMQIERALQLGIDVLPRDALTKATYYHTMMGYLPIENKLVEVESPKQIQKIIAKEFEYRIGTIPIEDFVPIIIERNGKFYLDINKTQANANLNMCKKIIQRTNARRILDLHSRQTELELKGKELEHWKSLIAGHEILPALNLGFPKY